LPNTERVPIACERQAAPQHRAPHLATAPGGSRADLNCTTERRALMGSQQTILVVDDDATCRTFLTVIWGG
jgi:hypothetical protein